MIGTRMNIGIRTMIIFIVLLFVFTVYIMRTEAVGATFATGSGQSGLEMKIDSRTVYNGVLQPSLSWALKNLVPTNDHFFNFLDVKPGDTGQNTISLHIDKNPAWVCLDFSNLKDTDNGVNEPESHVDTNGTAGGELSSALEFFAWIDNGNNKYDVGERALFGTSTQKATTTLRGTSYAVADSAHGPAILSGQTKYIGVTWCAGDLVVNTATAVITCNGAPMGNEYQTDSMSVDVSLRAVTSANNDKFLCAIPNTPKDDTCDAKKDDGKDKSKDDGKKDDSKDTKTHDSKDDKGSVKGADDSKNKNTSTSNQSGAVKNDDKNSNDDGKDDCNKKSDDSHSTDDKKSDDKGNDWSVKPPVVTGFVEACKNIVKSIGNTFHS